MKKYIYLLIFVLFSTFTYPVVQIQLRRDAAADWTTEDPTLAEGEVGLETDTLKLKIGDGVTAWTSLGYFIAPFGIANDNIVQIDDADAADNDYAKFTASGLEGRSYAEVLGDLSGQASGAFSLNSQNLTSVGTVGCGTITSTGNIIIADDGTIGSTTDVDIITLAADGTATFSIFPVTPSAAPDANYEVANKKYVDDNIGGAGASTALDNLASVAINTTLLSDTDNTDALGTTAIAWSDLFLGNESVITWNSAPSTPDVTLTHSANTLTFAGGTIVLGTATATGGLTGNVTGDCTGSSGSCTGEAATVANATFTTALTVDTGTLTLTADVGNDSVLTIGGGAVSVSGSNTGDQDLSGYLTKATYDAHTVLYATDDDTPAALSVTEQTLVGRLTGGNISAVAIGIADNNILQVDHDAPADNDFARFTAAGLEGRSYAETLGDLSGEATAAFSWNSQDLTSIGSIGETGTRITKGWFADLECTNDITIGGTALASTYAAIAQTMYIGTTQVAINRSSAALTLAGLTLTTPDIGTPSGGVLTSCTGLPYSGLADGTDGNLITWDADGAIAVVATGDAGQVLTSNGAGAAPTFQANVTESTTAGRSLTLSTYEVNADAELYTDTKGIWFENPTADDDFKSIWINNSANGVTITKIWAESDQTVTFMLQVDDGSPADCDSVDLAPAAGVAEDTSLNGDVTMAAGDRLDLAITSVSGTPTWVSIQWTFEYSD